MQTVEPDSSGLRTHRSKQTAQARRTVSALAAAYRRFAARHAHDAAAAAVGRDILAIQLALTRAAPGAVDKSA